MAGKQPSRWGFLQQAVASVESRLDNILSEENEQPATRRNLPPPAQTARDPVPSKRISSDLSRSSSNASASNDRLQERLAKAMAKKNLGRPESPAASLANILSSVSKEEETVPSIVGDVENDQELALGSVPLEDTPRISVDGNEDIPRSGDGQDGLETAAATGSSVVDDPLPVQSGEAISTTQEPGTAVTAALPADTFPPSFSVVSASEMQLKSEDGQSKLSEDDGITTSQLQQEINGYIERIDALQSKLKYLSKEAAMSARQAAAEAPPGTLEKKLLEKDEKIALLMEEGQNLSKTEIKYSGVIKKLRAQALTDRKEHDSIKARFGVTEGKLKTMEDRARKAEAASKRAEQILAANASSTNDLEAVRKERDALHATIADMKSQLIKANSKAEVAENKVQTEQLEKERRRAAELQDDLTSAKVEREISEEKLRRELKDLQAALEREKEQARVMESEMLGEQAALESKLESFRVRAEEASSADHGNVQAKLLRQIETLQSQYANASQNWQGIESTLLGRITNVEKERDEIAGREADLRKRLRDATLKTKNAEREIDALQTKFVEMDKSVAESDTEIQRLSRKSTQLEADLAAARSELEDQKTNSERELQRRLDEERSKWMASQHILRTESPGTSVRKNTSNVGLDLNHLMSPIQYDRGSSRRPSIMPGFDSNTPPRQYSTTSFRGLANGSIAETPSGVTSMDADEYFANVPPTPLSASHLSHRGVNDLVSTSTVGAGPSVQLVERMSANVRRLESEKAASKDELSRITGQRDEARQEVVNLMREVEEKRKIEERLKNLEKEHQDIAQRHRTTLEMLGEKSEQVEELKADIVDVKQMYRQLADTMK